LKFSASCNHFSKVELVSTAMQTDRGPNIESPGHGLSIVVEYGTFEQKAIGVTNGFIAKPHVKRFRVMI